MDYGMAPGSDGRDFIKRRHHAGFEAAATAVSAMSRCCFIQSLRLASPSGPPAPSEIRGSSMSWLHALIIAILQGATELFPVSSLGHAVVLPPLLGWNLDENSLSFLPFLVVLHLGTAAALLLYFWRDWIRLASALIGQGLPAERAAGRRLFGLILLATIPAVIFGFALEGPLRHLFGTPVIAALFLTVNGFVL